MMAVALTTATSAFAAASDAIEATPPSPAFTAPVTVNDFQLDTKMVVHGWVLCVSEATAETIVKARDRGIDEVLAAYADLRAAKSCGQFPELQVILHEPVYQSGAKVDFDARVYAASVNIGGGWPDGFVIYGALPDTR